MFPLLAGSGVAAQSSSNLLGGWLANYTQHSPPPVAGENCSLRRPNLFHRVTATRDDPSPPDTAQWLHLHHNLKPKLTIIPNTVCLDCSGSWLCNLDILFFGFTKNRIQRQAKREAGHRPVPMQAGPGAPGLATAAQGAEVACQTRAGQKPGNRAREKTRRVTSRREHNVRILWDW